MTPLRQFFEYTALNLLSKIAPKTFERAFEGAQVNRLTADWNSFAKTLNSDIRQGLPKLQQRSRDLFHNDPYAKKIIGMIGKNTVGAKGFQLRNKAMTDQPGEGGKLEQVLDIDTNKKVQEIYNEFCKKENCTITRDITKREADKLMIQNVALDGEIFKVKIFGKSVNKFGFTQQYLESDLCDITYNDVSPRGNKIVMGIEYDEYRRPLNYYFKSVDVVMDAFGVPYSRKRIEIPAHRVEHKFVRESFNQLRGIPWLAPSMIRLKMLKGFEDASLINARSSAMKTNILEPSIDGKGKPLTNANVAGTSKDSDGNLKQNLQPGSTYVVPDGYKHVTHDPSFPHAQHTDFRNTILQGVSSGSEVSFIRLANSYDQVNWTSGRMSLQDEQDTWKELHAWMIDHELTDTFETVLKQAMLFNLVDLDILDYDRINKPTFQGRTWAMVNPKDEVKANSDAWKARQKPLSVTLAEQGLDFEETIDQFAYELKYMEKKGVKIEELKENKNEELEDEKEKLKRAV